ncbi:hypothetical protein pb186bvf_000827 [Paramecium bursaria]
MSTQRNVNQRGQRVKRERKYVAIRWVERDQFQNAEDLRSEIEAEKKKVSQRDRGNQRSQGSQLSLGDKESYEAESSPQSQFQAKKGSQSQLQKRQQPQPQEIQSEENIKGLDEENPVEEHQNEEDINQNDLNVVRVVEEQITTNVMEFEGDNDQKNTVIYQKWKYERQLTIWCEKKFKKEQEELELSQLSIICKLNFYIQKYFEIAYKKWLGFIGITLLLGYILYLILL